MVQNMDSSDSPQRHVQRRGHRILGDYTLGKTLGVGSITSKVKVKLATHNVTGEKVLVTPSFPISLFSSSFPPFSQLAVMILPRTHISSPPTNLPADAATKLSKDALGEVRILRGAVLSMLLHHPYICTMGRMIIHQFHYYTFFSSTSAAARCSTMSSATGASRNAGPESLRGR